ncbi:MAG: autotransporter assembly complex protein TamA, partial [Boseongicola sp.]
MRWGKICAFTVTWVLATVNFAYAVEFVFSAPGADSDLRRSLAASSLVLQARNEKTEDPQELVAAARADYGRLLGVLYDAGRFGGVISISVDGREAAAIPPLESPAEVSRIMVQINPGPLFRFSETTVRPLPRRAELPEEFAVGQPAGTGAIRDAAEVAIDSWRLEGHAKARVSEQRIVASHEDRSLAAQLIVEPGPALRFGEVTVSGNEDVRTGRIHTIAGLEEGRDFDPEEIARAERRLRRTGSFSSVVVNEAENIEAGDTLPLDVAVVEQTPRRFGFGAEYSTIDGARLLGFWLHRNLLGGAERFRVHGEVAGIGGETGGSDYTFGARYERPATPRADVDLYAEFGIEKLDEPDFISYSSDFTLGFTRYATDDLTVEFGLGYLYSEVEDSFGTETYSLLTLPLGATLDRRDVLLDPTRGVFVELEATPFVGIDDSSDGAQINLDLRGYKTFGDDRPVTAALRLQLGSIVGPDLLESPQFFRYYSGGADTVRGQSYQSLAIDLGGGIRSGGRSFAGMSAEARVPVTEAISVVGFYDWGYVGEDSFPDGSGGSHSGAGIGLRYNTGIGPIRLDIAT